MTWAFAVPGDPATPTGGYIYDARVVTASGGLLQPLRLSDGFPAPDEAAISATRAALMAAGPCLIDGLAYGVLSADLISALPYRPVALCHHPLGLETGIAPAEQARLMATEKAALALAAHVIVTSDATKRTLVSAFGLQPDGVTVAPPGVDHAPVPHHKPHSGNSEGVAGASPVLLTVASLTRRKGHDTLADALAAIADLDWRALWVGPDDRDEHWAGFLRGRLLERNLAARVEIRGAVGEAKLHDCYAQAHLFVLPSRYEGYGMVFDEAMMRGLPVVACHAGAVPDVVPEGAGILVPPDDAGALAGALRQLLTDQATHATKAAGARAQALSLPGWGDTWARIHEVLRMYR